MSRYDSLFAAACRILLLPSSRLAKQGPVLLLTIHADCMPKSMRIQMARGLNGTTNICKLSKKLEGGLHLLLRVGEDERTNCSRHCSLLATNTIHLANASRPYRVIAASDPHVQPPMFKSVQLGPLMRENRP